MKEVCRRDPNRKNRDRSELLHDPRNEVAVNSSVTKYSLCVPCLTYLIFFLRHLLGVMVSLKAMTAALRTKKRPVKSRQCQGSTGCPIVSLITHHTIRNHFRFCLTVKGPKISYSLCFSSLSEHSVVMSY